MTPPRRTSAPPSGPRRPARVLVLAREAVLAALVGMLLEMEDYEPVFPEPGERPEEAIDRLRPPMVIVLDGEMDVARSDLFFARCEQQRMRVVLFSEPVAADAVRAVARARRCEFFSMPVERQELGAVLARAVAG